MHNKTYRHLASILKIIGIVLAADIIIFYIADYVFNGAIADWFVNTFVYQEIDMDTAIATSGIRWYRLRSFLMGLFIFMSAAVLLTIYFLSLYISRKQHRDYINKLTDLVEHYMNTNTSDLSLFTGEYAPIGLLLGQLRSQTLTKEKQLEQQTAQKNDLITYLAHDLKTPLASVIGYLCLLDENPNLPADLREQYTGITLEKAYRLEQLINEFFEITRFNLHKIVINPEKIHLKMMLMQLADEFYPILSRENKSINFNIPQDMIIMGDGDKLARVFNNILKNAAAYSYNNTAITIGAHRVGHYAAIVITNEGTPIPPHQLDTIFEKFYRLDTSRSTKTGGSGLGLAIAKEIVTAHRGTIQAESSPENTSFTVMLPLYSSSGTQIKPLPQD